MDVLKISSKITRGFISKFISSQIVKLTGYAVTVDLKDFDSVIDDNGKVHISLNVDAQMDKDSYERALNSIKL